ncbi:MAG: hypothetical protein QOJ12_1349, partial [Thermoleophilales bacterium]|nr:hypothetical protein [Thermoleophilales bacterium]
LDLGGLPRVSGPLPDIGAFEFQHPAAPESPAVTPEPAPQGAGRGPSAAPVDGLAPVLSGTGLTPRRFPAGARNVRLRFTLSEPASVAVQIGRELPGRRSGRRCLAPSQRRARAPRCTRLVTQRSLTLAGANGSNSVRFDARGLKPGSYRATLVPTDAAGNRGAGTTIRFVVARR